jgi:hypothetical protein
MSEEWAREHARVRAEITLSAARRASSCMLQLNEMEIGVVENSSTACPQLLYMY